MKKLNKCYTVTASGQVAALVEMEDEMVHTAENGYSCNDRTCPCQAALDEYAEFQQEYPFGSPRRQHEDWEDYL